MKFNPIPVGEDAVALIVSPDVWQGGVRALSRAQMKEIYEGRVTNWKDVGGPDRRIVFFNKEPGRGTWEVFAHWLYGDAKKAPPVSFREVGANEEARNKVGSTRGAISQLSASWADGKTVFALGLKDDAGRGGGAERRQHQGRPVRHEPDALPHHQRRRPRETPRPSWTSCSAGGARTSCGSTATSGSTRWGPAGSEAARGHAPPELRVLRPGRGLPGRAGRLLRLAEPARCGGGRGGLPHRARAGSSACPSSGRRPWSTAPWPWPRWPSLLAAPVAVAAAVFSAECLPPRPRVLLKSLVELLAGVPSVVYGLLGVLLRELGLRRCWSASSRSAATRSSPRACCWP